MNNESDKDKEPPETQTKEDSGRIRRFGVQVPLYKKILWKSSTQLSPAEYHEALERQRKYQEDSKKKWLTRNNVVIGVVILAFDFAILQLLPYLISMIGIHDQVLLGKWLIGMVGVITVATFIYIFTSQR
jgi:hypothetical protein